MCVCLGIKLSFTNNKKKFKNNINYSNFSFPEQLSFLFSLSQKKKKSASDFFQTAQDREQIVPSLSASLATVCQQI